MRNKLRNYFLELLKDEGYNITEIKSIERDGSGYSLLCRCGDSKPGAVTIRREIYIAEHPGINKVMQHYGL